MALRSNGDIQLVHYHILLLFHMCKGTKKTLKISILHVKERLYFQLFFLV